MKRYDAKGLPIPPRRILRGLTLRDLFLLAGMLVAFLLFVALWTIGFWWLFASLSGMA